MFWSFPRYLKNLFVEYLVPYSVLVTGPGAYLVINLLNSLTHLILNHTPVMFDSQFEFHQS